MKNDYYKRIADLLAQPFSPLLYKELFCILKLVCEDFSEDNVYSNFFSLLGVVCDSHGVSGTMKTALQRLRRRTSRLENVTKQDFDNDVWLLTDFIGKMYGTRVPASLLEALPSRLEKAHEQNIVTQTYDVLRVVVVSAEGTNLKVRKDNDDADDLVNVDLALGGINGNLDYVAEIVHRDTTLNLLHVKVIDNGYYVPQWIVVEPDYLVSPSDVAGMFEVYGVSPYNYLIKMFSPSEITRPLMLGIASGVFLDDLLAEAQEHRVGSVSYRESMCNVFKQSPVEISLMFKDRDASASFHKDAMVQFENIRQLLRYQMNEQRGFNLEEALLEPSFVCPALGLAGRMDFLQSDGGRLIEQKSGKRDEFRSTHREPHYVQMLLYQMMIEYTMGVPPEQCHVYLLYSRYADGLMREYPFKELLYKAMEMRNKMVVLCEQLADGKLGELMGELDVDELRNYNVSDKLWDQYVLPRLKNVLRPFKKTDKQSAVYLYVVRFMAFLMKENWFAKVGGIAGGGHGYADLWNNPAVVRIESGEMFANLSLKDVHQENNRIDSVTFALPPDESSRQTNFRQGDIVQVYAYQGEEPNVAHQFTLRGKLTEVKPTQVQVSFNNHQHPTSFFSNPSKRFAIEHDHVDSGTTVLCRSLAMLLSLPTERQADFLLTTLPPKAEILPLLGSYGKFDELVAKERASKRWFLVIGPPGSGKTSCALRYMVEEELRATPDGHILLMAYTNRAVDELCGMLEEIIKSSPDLLTDYLRLGHVVSASPQYHDRMMESRLDKEGAKSDVVRQLLADTRIVVATVSTMSLQTTLLRTMHFDVAFVDEASQILEPYILPVYVEQSVDRYVLVGDQKQLPAVVMQNSSMSAITDKVLQDAGLHNCAESLFSRMLHRFMSMGRQDFYYQINTQGRMHPELFRFVNQQFYCNRLKPVPLKHQSRSIEELYPVVPALKGSRYALLRQLATRRTLFVDCKPVHDGLNDKVNSAEAKAVARVVDMLAKLYEANGRTLSADNVGVIVPYRNQISMVRTCLQQRGMQQFMDMTIDTVERYQGSQRDIIIYSFTVRHVSQLDFLTSSLYKENDNGSGYWVDRKLNVALTRSREQLIVIGNKQLLKQVSVYKSMLDTIESQDKKQS